VSSAIDEPQMIALHVHLQVSITVAAAITTIPPTVQAELARVPTCRHELVEGRHAVY
jgi:hypothetical protein